MPETSQPLPQAHAEKTVRKIKELEFLENLWFHKKKKT